MDQEVKGAGRRAGLWERHKSTHLGLRERDRAKIDSMAACLGRARRLASLNCLHLCFSMLTNDFQMLYSGSLTYLTRF